MQLCVDGRFLGCFTLDPRGGYEDSSDFSVVIQQIIFARNPIL